MSSRRHIDGGPSRRTPSRAPQTQTPQTPQTQTLQTPQTQTLQTQTLQTQTLLTPTLDTADLAEPGSRHGSRIGDAPTAPTAPRTGAAILAAARSLALEVGFRKTTVVDVARRAGVSRMTVYREFDDIVAIWSRLLTDEMVGQLAVARLSLAGVPTARGRIIALAGTLIERIPEHPLFKRALELEPQILLPLIVTRFGSTQRAMLDELDRLLAEGREDGSIRADLDPVAAAGAILLTTQSFVFSARAIDTLPDAAATRAELPGLLERYLVG